MLVKLLLVRAILVKGAGVAIAMLMPLSTLSIRKPPELNVSMVKEDTGSVEMGLVNIDCTWTLKLVPTVAPLGIVKLIRDKVELVVEPQLTVANTVVPAVQEVLLIADKFAVIASGTPTRITPLDGRLFFGVNVIV